MSPFPTLTSLISTFRRFCHRPLGKGSLIGLVVWLIGAAALWYWLPYQPRFTLPSTEDSVVAGFSPDGRILATKLNNRKENRPIRLWDVDSGEEIGSFSTHGRFVDRIEFSSDGTILLIDSVTSDGSERVLSIIDRESDRELANLRAELHTQLAHLTGDGKTLVFNPAGPGRAKLWDIPAARERLTLNCWPAGFSPDGRWFTSLESRNELSVRSATTGFISFVLTAQERDLSRVGMSPDGTMLVGSLNTAVKFWDRETGRELACLNRAGYPTFSRNGKRLAAQYPGVGALNFRLVDTTKWQELTEFTFPPPWWNWSAILAGPGPSDLRVAAIKNRGTAPGQVERWMARHLPVKNIGTSKMFQDLKVFDIASGKELADYSTEGEIHVAPNAGTFAVDSGGTLQAPTAKRQCIQIFDIPLQRPLARILLWPLPVALLAVMISWLVGNRRSRRSLPVDSGR